MVNSQHWLMQMDLAGGMVNSQHWLMQMDLAGGMVNSQHWLIQMDLAGGMVNSQHWLIQMELAGGMVNSQHWLPQRLKLAGEHLLSLSGKAQNKWNLKMKRENTLEKNWVILGIIGRMETALTAGKRRSCWVDTSSQDLQLHVTSCDIPAPSSSMFLTSIQEHLNIQTDRMAQQFLQTHSAHVFTPHF